MSTCASRPPSYVASGDGRLPILTFDFEHFRATHPAGGFWQPVVDEARYAAAVGA